MAFPTAHGKTDRIKPCQSIKINQVNSGRKRDRWKESKNKIKVWHGNRFRDSRSWADFLFFFHLFRDQHCLSAQSVTLKPIFSFFLSVLYSSMRVCLWCPLFPNRTSPVITRYYNTWSTRNDADTVVVVSRQRKKGRVWKPFNIVVRVNVVFPCETAKTPGTRPRQWYDYDWRLFFRQWI